MTDALVSDQQKEASGRLKVAPGSVVTVRDEDGGG